MSSICEEQTMEELCSGQDKNMIFDNIQNYLTDTGLCGALRAMRILALEFLSKNEKRSRKRRGAKCPRKGHTVLWPTFFQSCIG